MPKKIKEDNKDIEVIKQTAVVMYGSFKRFSELVGTCPSNNIRNIRNQFKKLNAILKLLGYELTIKKR